MKPYILFFLFGSLLSCELFAQKVGAPVTSSKDRYYRKYATQAVNMRLEAENANVAKNRATIEQYIQKFKTQGKAQKITIPVVFIMEQTIGRSPDDKQIAAQLNILNQCFGEAEPMTPTDPQRLTAYKKEKFEARVGKPQIQFCLAKEVIVGNTVIKPIRRVLPYNKEWATDDKVKYSTQGGVSAINPEQYLNIWVAQLKDGISGYAQQPGAAQATDGIVISPYYFGNEPYPQYAGYNGGKTLIHLVGSYLGLNELWNERTPCGDDGVDDTPIHNSPNYGLFDIYKHISTCLGNPIEMTMNLMDNTDDIALYMFTEGQKMRMQAILSKDGARAKLALAGTTQCGSKALTDDPVVALRSNENAATANQNDIESVAIYPNPANDEITVKIQSKNISPHTVVVYNQLGSIVHQSQSGAEGYAPIILDTKKWQEGMYFFQIRLKDRQYAEKILIVH